ncbi:MAG: host attachment protein [Campylobacterales bacterium]|nr:host attachment protein [Campylobacterales bacterium]
MSPKFIIVADLQHFKLFNNTENVAGRETLELVESIDNLQAHQRLNEKVSDQQGNFQGVGASGSGEDHNIAQEEEHRRLKEIAQQITAALDAHSHIDWYFAAPKAINNQIIELLDPAVTKNMSINLHADLTKVPADELLGHFTK